MKKMTNKLIAIVVAMTLVFSMSGVAFAGISEGAAAPEKTATQHASETVKAQKAKNASKIRVMTADEMETLSIKTMATSATSAPAYDEWTLEPYAYGEAAVTATTTGYVWIDVKVTGSNPTDCVDFMVFENANDEYGYEMGRLRPGESSTDEIGFYLTKGSTYYFYFETPEQNAGDVVVSARAKMYSSVSNRTLPAYTNANQYMLSSSLNKTWTGTSDLYYKVVPKKTGLMTVNLKAYGKAASVGKITLYNASKKALSTAVQYKSSSASTKAYFGVTKGKTYYIRVQNCYDAEGNVAPKYGIRYGMTAYTDRNLPNNAKALKLTKGAKATNTLFTANNSTGTDTYKIYVPKTQTAKFTVNTQKIRSGNITIKVYKNGKQIGKTKTLYPNNTSGTYTITYGTKAGKASKGTYYIKVGKGAKVSGLYTIKYNK